MTDNGKCFTGRFGPHPVEVLFDRILRENGISHRHTGVRSPTTTGKIERFHQSLRREFLADRTFPEAEVSRTELDAWVADYKTQRPPAWPSRAPGGVSSTNTSPKIQVWSKNHLIRTVARARSGPVCKVRADGLHVKHQPDTNRQASAGT